MNLSSAQLYPKMDFVLQILKWTYFQGTYNIRCNDPSPRGVTSDVARGQLMATYLYFLLKVLDLLDTVSLKNWPHIFPNCRRCLQAFMLSISFYPTDFFHNAKEVQPRHIFACVSSYGNGVWRLCCFTILRGRPWNNAGRFKYICSHGHVWILPL